MQGWLSFMASQPYFTLRKRSRSLLMWWEEQSERFRSWERDGREAPHRSEGNEQTKQRCGREEVIEIELIKTTDYRNDNIMIVLWKLPRFVLFVVEAYSKSFHDNWKKKLKSDLNQSTAQGCEWNQFMMLSEFSLHSPPPPHLLGSIVWGKFSFHSHLGE